MALKELPKIYNPADYEDGIYEKWEKSGYFNPDNLKNTKGKYCDILPPPNANGELHIGHVSGYVVMDIFGRYNRMLGKKTLLLPGKDHAGIQTQVVYEKKLKKERGITRHNMGREKFYKEIYDFCLDRAKYMRGQEKKIGLSADWSREKFTLDPKIIRVVLDTFIKMYNEVDEDGKRMVYKGERIINWCPRCYTALADVEVEYEEQNAKLYTFKYSKDFPFAISTTRPETKLGDTAVAVNPKDRRYIKYVGKIYKVNFLGINLNIKIIADKNVNSDFGTGAVGVTPAHSLVDWDMAMKNKLNVVKVIGQQGKIVGGFGQFSDLSVVEAREKIIEKLKELGLLEREDDYKNNISVCERCGTAIEPLVSEQWFINVDHKNFSLKKQARKVIESEKIKIYPSQFKDLMLNWIDNVHDWCISRQIWWGPRIPVWYRNNIKLSNNILGKWNLKIYGQDIFEAIKNGEKTIETRAGRLKGQGKYWGDFKSGDILQFSLANEKNDEIIKTVAPIKKVVKKVSYFKTIDRMFKVYEPRQDYPGKSVKEIKQWWAKRPVLADRIKQYGIWAIELEDIKREEIYIGVEAPSGQCWVQDEDTFDTWFSSGQWAYTTLGYPDGQDYKEYYPSNTIIMGRDILPFWAFRMVILSLYRTKQIPFKNLYFTGLIRDEKGQKMSKSKGNGIEPLEMINKYGTDAVRLSLVVGATPGNDMNLGEAKIAGFRNFTNKLWNISRYIITNYELQITDYKFNTKNLTLVDKWILAKFDNLINQVTDNFNNYHFSQAAEDLRNFTWDDFADWYIECSKFEKNKEKLEILCYIFTNLLKLWHPYMPFITEVIWSNFSDKLLMIEKWPVAKKSAKLKPGKDFEMIIDIIVAIRNARAENKIDPAKKLKVVLGVVNEKIDFIKSQEVLIKSMRTGINELEIKEFGYKINNEIFTSVPFINIYIIGARDEAKEKARLDKEIISLEKFIIATEGKLANKEFIQKAPQEIVKNEKDKLVLRKGELEKLIGQRKSIK